ncbi:hypothetical protein EVAR_54903_1 [Eumeta japonica]|uniref:Uncharacterized protein n=1 Tax=Eumeta variegata TaxID=151549 RepID=A0A4C1YX70_EUMVA|nr:hypothetical protein EVAR_54903_1 [Eumeta japonica]
MKRRCAEFIHGRVSLHDEIREGRPSTKVPHYDLDGHAPRSLPASLASLQRPDLKGGKPGICPERQKMRGGKIDLFLSSNLAISHPPPKLVVKGSLYIDKISPRQGKIAQGKRDPYAAVRRNRSVTMKVERLGIIPIYAEMLFYKAYQTRVDIRHPSAPQVSELELWPVAPHPRLLTFSAKHGVFLQELAAVTV